MPAIRSAALRVYCKRARHGGSVRGRTPALGRIIALGSDSKPAISEYNQGIIRTYAFTGHIDRSLSTYNQYCRLLKKLIKAGTTVLADCHPGYHYRSILAKLDTPFNVVEIPHHYAHAAVPFIESECSTMICAVYDGTGYGLDGSIWGGEFILCKKNGFERVGRSLPSLALCGTSRFLRVGSIEPFALIGADRAVQSPHRIAISLIDRVSPSLKKYALNHLITAISSADNRLISRVLRRCRTNVPCSSMGRVFDAVAVLCGYSKREIAYESEPALYLTALARAWVRPVTPYRFTLIRRDGLHILRLTDIIAGIINDLQAGASREATALRFHVTIAAATRKMFALLAKKYGACSLGISGGVFQNPILLAAMGPGTAGMPETVYRSKQVSCTDAGLSCGQVLYHLISEGYHVSVSHR